MDTASRSSWRPWAWPFNIGEDDAIITRNGPLKTFTMPSKLPTNRVYQRLAEYMHLTGYTSVSSLSPDDWAHIYCDSHYGEDPSDLRTVSRDEFELDMLRIFHQAWRVWPWAGEAADLESHRKRSQIIAHMGREFRQAWRLVREGVGEQGLGGKAKAMRRTDDKHDPSDTLSESSSSSVVVRSHRFLHNDPTGAAPPQPESRCCGARLISAQREGLAARETALRMQEASLHHRQEAQRKREEEWWTLTRHDLKREFQTHATETRRELVKKVAEKCRDAPRQITTAVVAQQQAMERHLVRLLKQQQERLLAAAMSNRRVIGDSSSPTPPPPPPPPRSVLLPGRSKAPPPGPSSAQKIPSSSSTSRPQPPTVPRFQHDDIVSSRLVKPDVGKSQHDDDISSSRRIRSEGRGGTTTATRHVGQKWNVNGP